MKTLFIRSKKIDHFTYVVMMTACSLMLITPIAARTITVTNTYNEGKGSLRDAICLANISGEASLITFDISKRDRGFNKRTCTWQITPCTDLPIITVPLTIDGYTQRGAYTNCNQPSQASNAHLKIELCGSGITDTNPSHDRRGLTFGISAAGSELRGLAIHSWPIGVEMRSNDSCIKGCFLGLSADGSMPQPNAISILVTADAKGTCIGTAQPADRNVIYGLGYKKSALTHLENTVLPELSGAVTILGPRTQIEGTTIGLSAQGNAISPTACTFKALTGLAVYSACETSIGSPSPERLSAASPFSLISVTVASYENNIVITDSYGITLQNIQVGTDLGGTASLHAGTTGIWLRETVAHTQLKTSAPVGAIIINALISGHTGTGIVIGETDGYPVADVNIITTNIGMDRTGNPLSNGEHGIHGINCIDAKISGCHINYNGKHGICLISSLRTHINDTTLNYNRHDGLNLILPCSDENQQGSAKRAALAGTPLADFGVFINVTGVACGCTCPSLCCCYQINSCGNTVCC